MYLRLFCALFLLSSSLLAQTSLPEVASGLTIPNGSGALPFALDRYEGKPELVVIHHSTVEVNNHTGANVAGSLAGSFFYKPKMTTELPGPHARTVLHDPRPSFFVHLLEDPDTSGDSADSNTAVWALVAATATKDHRVFAKVQFTQLTGHAKRAQGQVDTHTESLGSGWVKITPDAPLAPGEYAVMPVPRAANTFAAVVFDFTLDPAGPNSPEAVLPKP